MLSKKGTMHISITLLVILTMVLVFSTIVYLNNSESSLEGKLSGYSSLEKVYAAETSVNNLIQGNIQKLIDSGKKYNSKDQFLDDFNNEFNYPGDGVKVTLDLKDVNFDKGITATFDVEIISKDNLDIDYKYEKQFSAN